MSEDKLTFTHQEEQRDYTKEQLLARLVEVACEKKATRPVLLDLRPQGGFTEFFVILSVMNARQAYAVAEEIKQYFKTQFDLKPISIDGVEEGTWVLMDYGFFFVHLFQDATRERYSLEQLWNKARMILPS